MPSNLASSIGEELASNHQPRDTIADFVQAQLSGRVQEGASFNFNQWRYEILDMDGDRIDKVLLTPASPALSTRHSTASRGDA